MAKKINVNFTESTRTMLRESLIPASTEKRFWVDFQKNIKIEAQEDENHDKELFKVLSERCESEINHWEAIMHTQNANAKKLLPDAYLAVIVKGLDQDVEGRIDVALLPWLTEIGFKLDPSYQNQYEKLVTFLLGNSNSLYKKDKDDNKVVKSDYIVRRELIRGVVEWSAYVRKQYTVCGTYLEPTFTKKVTVTAETAVL